MLARDMYSPLHISWILVYVFFGSSYMGFDIATKISPALGPPLMIVFVCITNVLLITSLISLLTNSLTKVCYEGFKFSTLSCTGLPLWLC